MTLRQRRTVWSVNAVELPPLTDALAALIYGFGLVGVAVLARRRDLPTIASSLRHFTSLLPVLAWALMPNQVDSGAALAALGSGMLYAMMAWVERSRAFGVLAAVAVKLAVLFFSLAEGFDGIEFYFVPVGLFLIMLGRLFHGTLQPAQRNLIRVVGGLLLYAPAALKLALQLGEAADGTYSVVFGAVCLVGIALGMVLHVRAWLVMGALFFTLDVVANLVNIGLRDHRIGFVVLSAAGLGILGWMVARTVGSKSQGGLVVRLRRRIRSWE